MIKSIKLVLPLLFFLCFPSASMEINVDGCSIISNAHNALGEPFFGNRPLRYPVYSCLSSSSNSNYDIHVIGVYEAGSGHYYNYHPTYTSNVHFNWTELSSDKPIILVLTTYEPIQWILHIPEGGIINKVILCSYHDTSVKFPGAQVLQVERGPRLVGYGSDSGGGSTERLLRYISSTYGPVSSFTGTYQANKWILTIQGTLTNTSLRQKPQTFETTDHLITTTEYLRKATSGNDASGIKKYYTTSGTNHRQKSHATTATENLQKPQQHQNILIISMAVIIALLSVFAWSMIIIFMVAFYRRKGKQVTVNNIVEDPPRYEEIKATENMFRTMKN